jgi:gas vesicle protein
MPMNDEPRPNPNTLMAFLAGGLLGAVAALLMAPQDGESSRAQIAKQIRAGFRREKADRVRLRAKRRQTLNDAPRDKDGNASAAAVSGDGSNGGQKASRPSS